MAEAQQENLENVQADHTNQVPVAPTYSQQPVQQAQQSKQDGLVEALLEAHLQQKNAAMHVNQNYAPAAAAAAAPAQSVSQDDIQRLVDQRMAEATAQNNNKMLDDQTSNVLKGVNTKIMADSPNVEGLNDKLTSSKVDINNYPGLTFALGSTDNPAHVLNKMLDNPVQMSALNREVENAYQYARDNNGDDRLLKPLLEQVSSIGRKLKQNSEPATSIDSPISTLEPTNNSLKGGKETTQAAARRRAYAHLRL